MTVGLDTSVVLRLITGEPEALAVLAFRTLKKILARRYSVIVSDLVASETYFALQHHFGMPKVEALEALTEFLRASGVRPAGAALNILAMPDLAGSNPGFVDRLIHAEYARLADEMLTFEKAARALPKTQVLVA
jgi:predicted nucleic acid-binding protein